MSHLLLEKFHQIINLSQQEEQLLLSLFTRIDLGKYNHFLTAHQTSRHVGLVEQGLLRYYMVEDGEEITYSFAKEGDFVSNYESFLSEQLSDKYIQALEDCVIWTIKKEALEQLYTGIREGERFGRLAIESVFVQILMQFSSLYRDDPETRYLKFTERHQDIQQRVPQYIVASYVGVKPPSLSRIRKRISQDGY